MAEICHKIKRFLACLLHRGNCHFATCFNVQFIIPIHTDNSADECIVALTEKSFIYALRNNNGLNIY